VVEVSLSLEMLVRGVWRGVYVTLVYSAFQKFPLLSHPVLFIVIISLLHTLIVSTFRILLYSFLSGSPFTCVFVIV